MAITVHEFSAYPNSQNEFLWPADKTTSGITAGSTHTTASNVRAVVVTCDADTRLSLSGASATVGGLPLLSAIENSYLFGDPAAYVLKFL